MLTEKDLQAIGELIEEKLDVKLKKALRGVARKRDLRSLENRITKKLNVVIGSFDRRLMHVEGVVGISV